MFFRASPWLLVLLLSACAVHPPLAPPVAPPVPTPAPTPGPGAAPPPALIPTPAVAYPTLKPVNWSAVSFWRDDDASEAWGAFLQSCSTLVKRSAWQPVCADAAAMQAPDAQAVRSFFEQRFQPYQATQEDGGAEGLVTGYYEPVLKGDRVRTARARYPLYGPPDDLITVDLASVYPELKNLRLRGRVVGNKLVPYLTRKEIDAAGDSGFKGKPIAWADDPVELFFLQVQGSGRIDFPDGSRMRVGYADQNGYPYQSIGRLLVERGALKLEQASMQGIKDWGAKHPDKLPELLAANPSYVFFRELPDGLPGPLGSLGVPLTGGRSIAVDPRYIPLGAPVFLATTQPNSNAPLNRLVMAQDTGGAIRGGVRADFFWGFGDAAGELAGRMKQRGRMWVLLPKDYPLVTVRR
ncbi:murein transglycosylase A [Thiobacillus sedimenti]|uniref:peptidoglycan lytic exotransglycosylase n=1 Tax=Thiobacillus sedimenti TaxID=3110231 RepID=A0ABZ1CPF0_9PROT|nr:MltA domain-containing protein [Thiobacillus sp. SCUT-2]WRS40736.1 MltA domain-containing protein [Thiobacillus sp. SCUT-2]